MSLNEFAVVVMLLEAMLCFIISTISDCQALAAMLLVGSILLNSYDI